MSVLKFCPECGAGLLGADPVFCAACGLRLPVVGFTQVLVEQAQSRPTGEEPSPSLDELDVEPAYGLDIPVRDGQILNVGSDVPFGLYRTTVVAESFSSTGKTIQMVNGCDGCGYGLFLADERSDTLAVSDDGLLIPIANLPSWDPLPLADDLIMGTCLVGVDIPPGKYRIDPYDGQGGMGQASRLDAILNSLSDHGFDSPTSDEPTVVDVEATDFALQFWGRPRRLV